MARRRLELEVGIMKIERITDAHRSCTVYTREYVYTIEYDKTYQPASLAHASGRPSGPCRVLRRNGVDPLRIDVELSSSKKPILITSLLAGYLVSRAPSARRAAREAARSRLRDSGTLATPSIEEPAPPTIGLRLQRIEAKLDALLACWRRLDTSIEPSEQVPQ